MSNCARPARPCLPQLLRRPGTSDGSARVRALRPRRRQERQRPRGRRPRAGTPRPTHTGSGANSGAGVGAPRAGQRGLGALSRYGHRRANPAQEPVPARAQRTARRRARPRSSDRAANRAASLAGKETAPATPRPRRRCRCRDRSSPTQLGWGYRARGRHESGSRSSPLPSGAVETPLRTRLWGSPPWRVTRRLGPADRRSAARGRVGARECSLVLQDELHHLVEGGALFRNIRAGRGDAVRTD